MWWYPEKTINLVQACNENNWRETASTWIRIKKRNKDKEKKIKKRKRGRSRRIGWRVSTRQWKNGV